MNDLAKKIEELKNSSGADLSLEEDLSIAVMNLISLEEHFFFTYEKTKKDQYYQLLEQTREMRKKLMAKMIPQNEGETWCISKHLLATTMRMMEVGTKYQTLGEEKKSKEMFDNAFKTFNMFWGIRLKLIDLSEIKSIAIENDTKKSNQAWGYEDILSKLVDCCRE